MSLTEKKFVFNCGQKAFNIDQNQDKQNSIMTKKQQKPKVSNPQKTKYHRNQKAKIKIAWYFIDFSTKNESFFIFKPTSKLHFR